MAFQLKKAVRENIYVMLGMIGASGSGKTYSALLVAKGLAGTGKIGFIDTEAKRGLHYADKFQFEHLDFEAPFSPDRYLEALKVLETAGCTVAVIDSASHEHAGDGGILEMHDAELDRMAGQDWKKREACNMAAWIKPKGDHKKFVTRLLQCRMHIIFCFRAEEKIEMVKVNDNGEIVEKGGKTKIIPKGWQPICEKNLPYEMTASFILTPDRPGYPKPVKLQDQHKSIFPLDRPLSEESGKLLAAWASGGVAPQSQGQQKPQPKVVNYETTMQGIKDAPDETALLKIKAWWGRFDHYGFAEDEVATIGAKIDERIKTFQTQPETEEMPL